MAARRVLLVEDNAGARTALESLLAEDGYQVETAASGARAIECAAHFQPDTVVCDFLLPDTDGLQVLRTLRRRPEAVFFIVLTAGCGDDASEAAIREEADLFLRKPVDLGRFRAALATAGDALESDAAGAHSPNREDARWQTTTTFRTS